MSTKKVAALEVKTVAIEDIKPWPGNPRKDHAVDSISKSIERYGYLVPIVVQKKTMRVLAGHGRLRALKRDGVKEVAVVLADLSDAGATGFTLQDNAIGALSAWDYEALAKALQSIEDRTPEILGQLNAADRSSLKALMEPAARAPDVIPDPPKKAVTQVGETWALGDHLLACGDSTSRPTVEQLVQGARASLLHADPPYGMGKEEIANDNLHGKKLDAFQLSWWSAWRRSLRDNASAYIWGNAEDLWRLWHGTPGEVGGLSKSERMTFRNEITWDKASAETNPTMLVSGVPLESRRMFQPSERCLFFMLGEQGFNTNQDNYWSGWDPIRLYLAGEVEKMGWGPKDVERLTGVGMYGHWFTKSQWVMIPEAHYRTLQEAAKGKAFLRPYGEARDEYQELRDDDGRRGLVESFYATRAYFDNTHDRMTDVWSFARVQGADRFGHVTPKPVDMMERIVLSSSRPGEFVVEPFSGSGSTLIACENAKRRCLAMELEPRFVDVAVARWQKVTGKKAKNLTKPGRVIE